MFKKQIEGEMLEGIAAGVIGNYMFSALTRVAPKHLKSLWPAAIHANPRFLTSIEKELQDAKAKILRKYRGYSTISIFFDEKTVSRMKVLDPIFDHLFMGKSLDEKRLEQSLRACIGAGEAFKDGKLIKLNVRMKGGPGDGAKLRGEAQSKAIHGPDIKLIIQDIVHEIRESILAEGEAHKETILQMSLAEIRHAIRTMEINGRFSAAPNKELAAGENNEILKLLSRYHEYIRDTSTRLVVHGLNEAVGDSQNVRHSIESAYVPLTMNPVLQRERSEPNSDVGEEWRGNAMSILKSCPFVVLRGNAGCGKTTLMQWYILNSGPISSKDQKRTLPVAPIYVPLRRLEASRNYDWSLSDLMQHSVPNETIKRGFSIDWIEQAEEAGLKLSFLLDGVDEISEARREKFWSLVREIRKTAPSARVVITSRHLSAVHLSSGEYRLAQIMSNKELLQSRGQWDLPEGFLEFVMSPLSDDEVFSFIEKWHLAIDRKLISAEDNNKIDRYAENLVFTLLVSENSEAIELCRTPLLCGLLCLVYFIQGGKLPASRRQLYEIATKILAKVRDEHREIADDGPYSRIDLRDRLSLLRHIALTMQEGAGEVDEGQTIEVDKETVSGWVRKWLDSNSYPDLDENFVLRKLVERSSLIREPTVNKIDFVHRSFMEFLSANEIVLKREPFSIQQHIEHDQWWSTLQFCMDTETGAHFFAGELLKTLVEYVIREKKGDRSLLVRVSRLLASASEIPVSKHAALADAFSKIVPPRSWDEVDAFVHFPFECIGDTLNYSNVDPGNNNTTRQFCAALLAKHPDLRSTLSLLSGYHQDQDRELIRWVNHSLKLSFGQQSALIARLKNGSFKNTVYLKLIDFSENLLADLRFRKAHISCRDLPVGDVSFKSLRSTIVLSIEGAGDNHWDVLEKHLMPSDTTRITMLELNDCKSLNCESLAILFPNIVELRIRRCQQLDISGLSEFASLARLDISYVRQRLKIDSPDIPATLKSLRASRDIVLSPGLFSENKLEIETH